MVQRTTSSRRILLVGSFGVIYVFVATRTYVTIYLLLLSLLQQLASVVIKGGRCWVEEVVQSRNGAGKSQQEQMDLDEGLRKESASEY